MDLVEIYDFFERAGFESRSKSTEMTFFQSANIGKQLPGPWFGAQ